MPKGKSLKEWIDIYEEKTGDKFGLPKGFRLCYLAERGFCEYRLDVEGKIVLVYQLCGDAKFWRDSLELIYSHAGFDAIGTICIRHIKPYIRSFGWQILTEMTKNGQKRYLCQDSIGRKVICTEIDKDENGEASYMVTHYFKEKAVSTLNDIGVVPTPKGGDEEDGDMAYNP